MWLPAWEKDDGGWDVFPTLAGLFGKSPAGAASWMCWGMSCDAWAVSELITVQSSSTGKVCSVRTYWCPVLFHFSYDWKEMMPSWKKLGVQMVYQFKRQLPGNNICTLKYLNANTHLNIKTDTKSNFDLGVLWSWWQSTFVKKLFLQMRQNKSFQFSGSRVWQLSQEVKPRPLSTASMSSLPDGYVTFPV